MWVVKLQLIRKNGFSFEFNPVACQSCDAKCCRGKSGNIWVNLDEIQNICKLLNLNLIDGLSQFFQKRDNRYSIRENFNLSISDSQDYPCIFLDKNNRCSIYPVRPLQCQTFPFWDHFKQDTEELFKECLGLRVCPTNTN
ncbi:MAG: YkgJ family cysteine cluster protein [Desulfamplus sp.]|nr:YkgJ family cysteine cluster protein [Desulfamplus sp.]MBF0389123.1 YkgJ family cysteine cluster protein [Desulfamplus sp.]